MQSAMPIFSPYGFELVPRVCQVQRALITETRFDHDANTQYGAAYHPDGCIAVESLRPSPGASRPGSPLWIDPDQYPPVRILEEAIYGGHLFFAWGHFLLETLSTAYAAEMVPIGAPLLLSPWGHTAPDDWAQRFIDHVMPLLRAAGWGSREVIVTRDQMTIHRLHLPSRLSTLGVWQRPCLHDRMRETFERIRLQFPSDLQGRKVVAMRPVGHRRRHPSEAEVYAALETQGWYLISLHELSAAEQVSIMDGTCKLVSFSGSTLHNSAFMASDAQVIEIGDSDVAHPNYNQRELCRISNQHLSFVRGFAGGQARPASQILEEIERHS